MVFTSITFLALFLPAFLAVYYLIPQKHLAWRNAVLLVFSFIFYGWGGVRYLGLLLFSVTVNYLSGLFVGPERGLRIRKVGLTLSIVLNLAVLCVFKYTGFVSSVFRGAGIMVPQVSIALPIGISFYTFQGMSYVLDVYRGKAKVSRNPLTVALYISLFPQLVAGPIVRYADVANELTAREHTIGCFASGTERFMLGFAKKLLLADAMGAIADRAFLRTGTELLTLPLSWIGIVAFALQIYFDFSAYSDMAIGLGRMAGFHFSENFRDPYLSASVTEFWRRWHISLSTWFRDYVYIPLGGNRCAKPRQAFNLLLVWTLTGLWHGANWTFLAWGVYYGVLILIEKFVIGDRIDKIPGWIRHFLTMLLVLFGWVLFRADSITDACVYFRSMFGMNEGAKWGEAVYVLRENVWEIFASFLFLFPWKQKIMQWNEALGEGKGRTAIQILITVFSVAAFIVAYGKLASGSFSPFIYFQF
ncbi:MAG: MBOAT family protein [Clostridiales bacterium]|nr:MBOAT family protein [Clostridiales bacterium]